MWKHPSTGWAVHGGAVNDQPAFELLADILSEHDVGFQRRVTVCATNIADGEWNCFN